MVFDLALCLGSGGGVHWVVHVLMWTRSVSDVARLVVHLALSSGEQCISQGHGMGARPSMLRHCVDGLNMAQYGMVTPQLWYGDDIVIAW